MTAREFAELIPESRPYGNGWLAHCPVHGDRIRSLKIDAGNDGRVLVKCFAGCTVENIVEAYVAWMPQACAASVAHRVAERKHCVAGPAPQKG